MSDREIHSAEHQTGMNIHYGRPSCWTAAKTTPLAPGFHDNGRSCGVAMTPDVWRATLEHTPGCSLCRRASRALTLYARKEPRRCYA